MARRPRTPDTFTLSIEIGSDAARTGSDVAAMLRAVADRLDDLYGADDLPTFHTQNIKDGNGNTVGWFRLTDAEGGSSGLDRFYQAGKR